MEKIPCSAGILTFNSAKTLRRALESVKDFDDIVLCDGGSTDETLALAAQYGARVIAQDPQFKNDNGTLKNYAGVRNQLMDAAKNPWILYIDADEAASPQLVEEIREVAAKESPCAGYLLPEQFIVAGRVIAYASNYPGYQYRLLRTDRGTRFVKPVHEQPPKFLEAPPRSTLRAPWQVFWEQYDVDHYKERNYKYLPLEVGRASGLSRREFFAGFLPWHLHVIAAVTIKTLRDRILHPWAIHMPLKVEWERVRYQWALIRAVARRTL